ncbi:MAG: oligosaccharide flippase family protein [Saprospiraceae bacterium]|uniref:Oligosaccharide flippase family protein n=1 Tax=Candidatus Opimibacter skivensis TaxID=2982028 RepID=A0A9D7SWV8_9BACT|nr:oligosaccharide flippase family protein [Candidatus Opimibacter skivensis]
MIKDFLRSSANVLFADIGTKAIGFGVLSLLTFILEPEILGKYNALLTTITSIYGMSGLGLSMVLQRESAKHSVKSGIYLGEIISAGFMCMSISILGLVVLFQIFHDKINGALFGGIDSSLIQWVPWLTLLYFLVQAPLSLILGLGMFKVYSFRNMIEAIVTGICILIGGKMWGLPGVIYGLLVSYSINAIIVGIIIKKVFVEKRIQLVITNWVKLAYQSLRKGIPYFVGNVFLGSVANIILIGLFAKHIGFAELGYLRIGLSLAAILMVVPNAAKTVTVTYIAKQEANSTRLQSIQMRYLFFLIVTSTLLLTIILAPVVSFIFGNEYDAGVQIYIMILLINIFISIYSVLNSFIAGKGHLVFSGLVSGIVMGMYILLAIFLIPTIGINGYYISFGGSYFTGMIILIVYDLRMNAYNDKRKIIWFLSGTFGILGIAFLYSICLQRSWLFNLLFLSIIGMYILFCTKYVFESDEKKFVNQIISKARFIGR